MPARKIDFWRHQLKSIKANHPSWGAGRITRELQQAAARSGREGAPGERWVGNRLRDLEKDPKWKQEEEKYRVFYWPESMERDDLPWEASASAIEMLRYYRGATDLLHLYPWFFEQWPKIHLRPSINEVRWFWRVTQAIPEPPKGMSPDDHFLFRVLVAETLSDWDKVEGTDTELIRTLEDALLRGVTTTEHIEELRSYIQGRIGQRTVRVS